MRSAGAAVFLVTALALGGCSMLPGAESAAQDAPATSAAAPAKDAPEAPAEPAKPPTAAQAFTTKLNASLSELATTTKAPNRDQMLSAMLAAGAVKEKTELSVDITPTGLAVDAVEAATLVGEECVIGQVRDGNVAVTILPVLASGRCFVGDVH